MNNVHPVFEGILESFIRKEFDKGTIHLPGTDRETVKPEGWGNFSPAEQIVYLSGESDGFCRGTRAGWEEGVRATKMAWRKKITGIEKYANEINASLNILFQECLDEEIPF